MGSQALGARLFRARCADRLTGQLRRPRRGVDDRVRFPSALVHAPEYTPGHARVRTPTSPGGHRGKPMPHTLREAAKAVGKDRTTLMRAIRLGRLSAVRDA